MKKILSANFVFSIGFFVLVGTNLSTSIAADKTIVPRMVEAKANVEPTNQFGLGDNLIVKVDNLDALVEAAAKANKKLILYLNRMPLTGLYPEVENKFFVRLSCGDRKSTRLNSSHQIISYAVFCLKKK